MTEKKKTMIDEPDKNKSTTKAKKKAKPVDLENNEEMNNIEDIDDSKVVAKSDVEMEKKKTAKKETAKKVTAPVKKEAAKKDTAKKDTAKGASAKNLTYKKNDEEVITDAKAIFIKLAKEGKQKGILTYRQIVDAFERVEITPEQIEKIYESLEKHGIEVVPENPDEDYKDIPLLEKDSDDEKEDEKTTTEISVPEGVSIDDPVRMYLKEIGRASCRERV